MCGIAGVVTSASSATPDGVLRRMTDAIRHRGPDDSGYYQDAFASLGHRRLSIIDLSTGDQPMFNESGSMCVIYNGEIFNHAELRPVLERAGHQYKTKSDTETILHAYEEYGPDCVTKFRGMFAFALWDVHARTLFCARDRLGIKPFYYYWDGNVFAFASEIKALLQHPAVSPALDDSQLSEYLAFGYTSDERTLFRGIRKLLPGHLLRLTPTGLTIDRYWKTPCLQGEESRDDESWIAECRARLEETVRMRLMSDVPLGMFLSGGIDSSAIAALMARMVPGPVKTFSVGYKETEFSELTYAASVAKVIKTDHHEVVIGREDFFGALPKLIWHEDEPIVWPSSVSLYFVSKLAAEQVKVVLTGEGADEMFGGYGRYHSYLANQQWMAGYAHVPEGLRNWIRSTVETSDMLSASIRRKLGHTLIGREPSLESLYLDNFYAAFSADEQRQLLASSSESPGSQYDTFLRHWNAHEDASVLKRLLYADQKTYLVELLMKQDQMSMACSIESRVPFLDHPFVEFAAAVPDRLKIRDGIGKYILKQAVKDLLPHDIIFRKKMGFPTPIRSWLHGAHAAPLLDALRDRNGLLAQYLHLPALNAMLERHQSGRIDATDRIWRLINLQLWGRIFLSGRPEAALTYDENPVGQV
ncbi:MAG TPA: asparagine synthase (glutamine-hydrolyzing) [Vicinamibacterales bacterium]|nr:asparagine synthase (glutamine-hydrolyzing) [Vicinamibacterales bacterium]